MKIYMFYFRDNNEKRVLEPVLYAYTNNKEYADRFKDFRNMKKFLCIEKELTKDQYKDVIRVYPNYQLTKTEFYSKSKESPTTEISIEIICTWNEEKQVIIESDEGVFRLFTNKMFNPLYLSMDVKAGLLKLGFFTLYQYLYQNMYIAETLNGPEYAGVFHKDAIVGDFVKLSANMQKIKADQLEMFMFLFGGTVKV